MYDVIVIGAGYGGVTCAAALTHEGHRVLLVDKNAQPGGKAVTVRAEGFAYELWPIAGGPADMSRFHELAVFLGRDPEEAILLPEQAGEFRYKRDDGTWAVVPFSARPSRDPAAMVALPTALGASEGEVNGLMRLVGAVFSTADEALADLDEVSALDWVRGFGIGHQLESYLFMVLNLLFVVAVDRLPASEAVKTLRDFFAGGGGRYHLGGFGQLAEDAVDYVVARGGEFRPCTRVERILVEDGSVKGIETSEGTFLAPVVVSNAGVQPTVLNLAGPEVFPSAYVEKVESYEPSWAFVGIRYVLDAPVIETPMTLRFSDESWWDEARYRRAEAGEWAEDPLLFVIVPAEYDASLAPEGRQMVLAGTMCSPDPDSPMNQAAIEHVDRLVRATWPGIDDHIVRKDVYDAATVSSASRDRTVPGTGGECIGLAQIIGQCGATKPDVRSPVSGLYFTGCDAGGYGCGTHQAVDSGFNVAEIVAADRAGHSGFVSADASSAES